MHVEHVEPVDIPVENLLNLLPQKFRVKIFSQKNFLPIAFFDKNKKTKKKFFSKKFFEKFSV